MKKIITFFMLLVSFISLCYSQKIVENRLIDGDATITKEIKVLNVPAKKINNRIFRDGTIIRIVVKDFDTAGKVIKIYVFINNEEFLIDRFYSESLKIARLKDSDNRYSFIIYDENYSYCILTYETVENINGYVLDVETKVKQK